MVVEKFFAVGSSAQLVEDVVVAFIWRLEHYTVHNTPKIMPIINE